MTEVREEEQIKENLIFKKLSSHLIPVRSDNLYGKALMFGIYLSLSIFFLSSVICPPCPAKHEVRSWMPSASAQPTNSNLNQFFGTYVGQADIVEGDDSRKRDLEVTISPYRRGKGFTIEWVTVSYHKERKEPGVKRRSTIMSFTPTDRNGLYKPEQNNDVFSVNNDNEKENGKDQIVWARLLGNTLSLYSLRVNDKGDYSLHIYHRQLTDKGILMQFESLENGIPAKHVEGELIRVEEEED